MLEFVKRELEFKYDGEVYRLKYPSVKEMSAYSKAYEASEEKLDCIIDFLAKLGLKKKVCEELEVHHLTTIIKALTEEKK